MIVIPECGGGLIIVVDVIATDAGNVPVFGEAVVFGASMSAVQVCDSAYGWIGGVDRVVESAIDCGIDGQQMFCGQIIDEADFCGRSGLCFDGDAR